MKTRILVVDDEKILRFTFKEFLSEAGYDVATAASFEEALVSIKENDLDLIFTDIILGGRTGMDLLREIKAKGLMCPVVVITGFPNIESASEAVRLGAFDYIQKPVEQAALLKIAGTAIKYREAVKSKEAYRADLEAIFSSVREGIISVDKDLNVITANAPAMKMCGLTAESIGSSFKVQPGHCQGFCTDLLKNTLKSQRTIERERIECRRKDMPSQVVSVSVSPLTGRNGDFRGAIMVMYDETRLVGLERDLGRRKELKKIVGNSRKMQDIYSSVENLANLDTTVLITGESGTGKELIAEALHSMDRKRSKAPFVIINCAAIPENLIESEFFGHEKGAFTGAAARQIGKFEMADKGVIFLDEIGDMSFNLQSKLLRVMQESEFYRIGGKDKVRIDVRIIAATNKDLREMVSRGAFREDLYYRLKVIELDLPPLRERMDDIPELTRHFLRKFNEKFGKNIGGCSVHVQKAFMDYNWPGNVRELEHVLERACVICDQSTITVDHLPDDLKVGAYCNTPLQNDEPEIIRTTLEKVKWNKAKAARLLGIDRSTLYRKMEKYGLRGD